MNFLPSSVERLSGIKIRHMVGVGVGLGPSFYVGFWCCEIFLEIFQKRVETGMNSGPSLAPALDM